jgi:hypothetical protein
MLKHTFTRNVYVQLPYRPVLPGETFTAPVYAQTTYAVAGFRLQFTTSALLSISDVRVDTSRWTAQIARSSTTTASVNALLSVPQSASQAINQPAELLSR